MTVSRRESKAKPQTGTAQLTRWLAKVQKKGLREFERKRRNWPGLNFIMEYGIKQAAAALFLADIVSACTPLCTDSSVTCVRVVAKQMLLSLQTCIGN